MAELLRAPALRAGDPVSNPYSSEFFYLINNYFNLIVNTYSPDDGCEIMLVESSRIIKISPWMNIG